MNRAAGAEAATVGPGLVARRAIVIYHGQVYVGTGGDTDFPRPDGEAMFKISRASAELLRETWGAFGALVTGRRDFEVSNAWGGQPPLPVPTFIVTHTPPQAWDKPGSPFTFITDGVESAVERGRQAAGDKNVAIGGTTITQQCLQAGLLDGRNPPRSGARPAWCRYPVVRESRP